MFKNTKLALAIILLPLLGLGGYMAINPLNVETDTSVERQEFSVVEQKAIQTEVKVAEIDTKVQEVVNVQAEQAKQIEEVKAQVQEVKTVYVQAPVVQAVKVVEPVKIDYCKEIADYFKIIGKTFLPEAEKKTVCNFVFGTYDKDVMNYGIQVHKETNKILLAKNLNSYTTATLEEAKAFISAKIR